MLAQSPRAVRTVIVSLLLGLVTLLHSVFTPALSHLITEEPGCPHLRAVASAPAVSGGTHLRPPPVAAAAPGRTHPEHDPGAHACPGRAATRVLGHLPPRADTANVSGFHPSPRTGGTATPAPTAPGTSPAALRQILRC